MPFGIYLLFDGKTEKHVRKIGARLEKQKVPTIFSFLGGEPHVSLAVFESCDLSRLKSAMDIIARQTSGFEATLSSVGSFPGKEGVLFLAPVVTSGLLKLNDKIHMLIERLAGGEWDYYKPGGWVPHCTLSINLSPPKLLKAFNLVKQSDFRVAGHFNRLVLEEVSLDGPPLVRVLHSLPLSGATKSKTKGK